MRTSEERISSGGHIFLIGALRSGTTMLRLMIDHHPEITFSGEFEYVTPMISDEGEFPPLQDYYSYLESNRGFLMDALLIDKTLDFKCLCRSFLTQRQTKTGTLFVGSTVHNNLCRLPYIWPEARYIRLTRDGRDVARSFIPMGWAGNVWKGVEHWIESEQAWCDFKKTLPETSWIEIKFENLLENPVEELSRLCGFIGVPYRKEMLDYPRHTTYNAPIASLAHQWKRKQTDLEVRLIESRIGNMLKERGYELSGLPPLEVTPIMLCRLQIQNKVYRLHFRIKSYGLRLSASEMLARRLNLKHWHAQLKTRMNQITMRYLK